MIYLPHHQTCSTAEECTEKCSRDPETCTSTAGVRLPMKEGIWSKDPKNNPFADYFKARELPSTT